jgi:hypothetical protein
MTYPVKNWFQSLPFKRNLQRYTTVAMWPFRDATRGFAENRAKRIVHTLKRGHAPGIDLTSLVYKPRWDINDCAVYEAGLYTQAECSLPIA